MGRKKVPSRKIISQGQRKEKRERGRRPEEGKRDRTRQIFMVGRKKERRERGEEGQRWRAQLLTKRKRRLES